MNYKTTSTSQKLSVCDTLVAAVTVLAFDEALHHVCSLVIYYYYYLFIIIELLNFVAL